MRQLQINVPIQTKNFIKKTNIDKIYNNSRHSMIPTITLSRHRHDWVEMKGTTCHTSSIRLYSTRLKAPVKHFSRSSWSGSFMWWSLHQRPLEDYYCNRETDCYRVLHGSSSVTTIAIHPSFSHHSMNDWVCLKSCGWRKKIK